MPGKKAAHTKKTAVNAYNRTEHDRKKSGGTVKIKWVVSFISCTDDMRQTIRGLGLRRMHQVVERQDTPSVRGMIHKVRHLVEVVGESDGEKKFKRPERDAQAWPAQTGGAGVQGAPLLHALEFAASRGLAQEEGSRGPRHGFEARQDRGRRQQGTEVAPRLFAPPRL